MLEEIPVPKVMVVDDEETVRRTVVKMLQKNGYEVIEFSDAALALDEVDLEPIELILTNLRMPTPGEQFIQEARKRGVKTPIVVMSGYLPEEKMQLLASLGVQAVLKKPFALATLLQTIQAHKSSR